MLVHRHRAECLRETAGPRWVRTVSRHAAVPGELSRAPFRGSVAVGAGLVTKNQLRGPAYTRLFRGIYVRRELAALGVRRVALPHTGRPSAASRAQESERWFQRSYRWRAGIEGRIGVLQRGYGLARCADHGAAGLERWVGWGVLTANLVTIARATAAR